MRFFTGLHSERLSQLEVDYMRVLDDQAGKREAVRQIRTFMQRFDLGSELDVVAQLEQTEQELTVVEARRIELERSRTASTHPSDPLRQQLRGLGGEIADTLQAIDESKEAAAEQKALRAEFIMAKTKGDRTDHAVAMRSAITEERARLQAADANIRAIADEFKRVLLAVGFPGVSEADHVDIAPQNWRPVVSHGDQHWGFWDAGSGGKKTLFNVCYALALHRVALRKGMPIPSLLVIDSPTKNISDDENPELIRKLYDEIYDLALARETEGAVQLLLIDSDLVEPSVALEGYSERRLAGEEGAPRLIPYYIGP